MSDYTIFIGLLALYIGSLVGIGLYYNKKQKSSIDFFLAGRELNALSIGFSAAASWLTAGALLAVTGFFMLLGMGSIWGFVAPNIIALLVIALLVRKLKRLPAVTQPELLEMRYGGSLRGPVALVITIVMILFAVSDIKGFSMVLEIFYGLDPLYSVLIVGAAVALYVNLGGFSAVVFTDRIQFLMLFLFIMIMAVMTTGAATDADAALDFSKMMGEVPGSWYNPFSVGLPMVLIFTLSIVPGWITEQDPWQKVWAAKDEKAAQSGMLIGAVLVTLVFAGCAVIAIALNRIYPEIAAAGFPAGMAKAEPALLVFIKESGFSRFGLAFCAIGLATAAMSCADTFATSGASCISRDLYQRYVNPNADEKQIMRINRLSVLFIIAAATICSYFIHNIIEAIHIATFIASASCFFPLMGGLFWRRATHKGAMASITTGAGVQIVLVLIDLIKTPPMAPGYLESLSPILSGHGVIVGMFLSGLAFIAVSFATPPVDKERLDRFFPA
ncbi:sodium:solute symporter [Desulfoluna sp.]|uniref:sodium:solute symporter family protein n=1 Tax=Desulfoluna sp. TaxID=2045199 RepID=UPI0026019241|nr:sodium:solute symporter family protein [Desulfoluna sp.]